MPSVNPNQLSRQAEVEQAAQRYLDDAPFHALVDSLREELRTGQITDTDLKLAVALGCALAGLDRDEAARTAAERRH